MASESIDVSQLRQLELRLARMRRGINREVKKVIEDNGEYFLNSLQEQIRLQKLVATGAYLESWHIEHERGLRLTVATGHPAANRLEHGFVGQDSMGRHYDQAPRPHVQPAKEDTMMHYKDDLRKVVRKLWRS